MSRCVDVIVVGAGFAGLAAAIGLREAGLSTAIFEARDRVGGRVAASRNGLGEFCDVGGQYLCDDMTELMGIIRSQGKSLIELEMRGRYRGQPSPRTASETSEDPTANFFSRAWETYEILGTCMREGASKITVAGWIGGLDEPPTVKVALRSMLECICCRSVEDIPLWHLIEHCKRIKSQKDEMQYFVRETLHSVAVCLANANGDALRLKSPVTKIRWWDSGVELEVGGEL